jgi:hypothetical protein
MFYCASTEPMDLCPKAERWEQRGLTFYTLASSLQKQKARSNPYVVIFNFIGYFSLVLCDFPFPGAMWPSSCSDFSGFISLLCHPCLPATFSGLKPRLFSFDLPLCYITTVVNPVHLALCGPLCISTSQFCSGLWASVKYSICLSLGLFPPFT